MKYASESGRETSVHSWKPCPPDTFARLMHRYASICCNDFGHAGLSVTAVKLDRTAIASIFYRPKRFPEHCGVSTPVLMTVSMGDGKVICFERIASDEYPALPDDMKPGDLDPASAATAARIKQRAGQTEI